MGEVGRKKAKRRNDIIILEFKKYKIIIKINNNKCQKL